MSTALLDHSRLLNAVGGYALQEKLVLFRVLIPFVTRDEKKRKREDGRLGGSDLLSFVISTMPQSREHEPGPKMCKVGTLPDGPYGLHWNGSSEIRQMIT